MHCNQCNILQQALGWNLDVDSPVKVTEIANVKIKECVIPKCKNWPLKGKLRRQRGPSCTPYSVNTPIQHICPCYQLVESRAYSGSDT